jgi:predicted tellurium resistance membrane protein TerC/YHS domain-containing protein
MLRGEEIEIHPESNPVIRLFQRFVPVTARYSGSKFLVKEGARVLATPLLLVLVVIDVMDLVFAVDSIPAVFAVTRDPFIVYTSNIFAILGLRALYFVLAAAMTRFRYLSVGLGAVLAFVGLKMLISEFYDLPIVASLVIVGLILGLAVFASLLWPLDNGEETVPKETKEEAVGLKKMEGTIRMATDPVCKMEIDESKAAGTSVYKGTTYYFCALGCKKSFDQNPEKYLVETK